MSYYQSNPRFPVNVVSVNIDGFANAVQVTTGNTGPFAVAQPINTNINGSLGIGFYYLWTTAPATLSNDFTFEYIFLQSNLSSTLNQGMADLTLQLLDPPAPVSIDVTDFALTPVPAPEPAGAAGILLGAAFFSRRRRHQRISPLGRGG